jgi:hypothetical protein
MATTKKVKAAPGAQTSEPAKKVKAPKAATANLIAYGMNELGQPVIGKGSDIAAAIKDISKHKLIRGAQVAIKDGDTVVKVLPTGINQA